MKLTMPGTKAQPHPGVSPPPPLGGPTTQDWLPIQSILDGILTRPDGTLIAGLLIQPMNLSLMARPEQHRVVGGFRSALDRLTSGWQIVSTFRPVDLGFYRQALAEQSDRLTQGMRRQVLDEYRRWILGQAQGRATERMHAMLVSHPHGKGAGDELRKTIRDLHQDLQQIEGLHAAALTNGDWYRIVQLIFSGNPGFVDASGPGRLAPIYTDSDDITRGDD